MYFLQNVHTCILNGYIQQRINNAYMEGSQVNPMVDAS